MQELRYLSALRISTRTVCGHPLREFESTHSNVCKGSLQKTRGEVCKVSKKMWRCIAVLLKLVSPIFYTFLWWALHKNISSNGTTTALFKNRIEKTRNDAFFTFNLCCQWTQTTKFWTFPSKRNSNKEKSKTLVFQFTDNINWMWKMHRVSFLDSVLE